MDGTQDISKIIGIIMENPDIIEKIKSIAEKNDTAIASSKENTAAAPVIAESKTDTEEKKSSDSTYDKNAVKKRRHELLSALKPYVRSERAKAIDTMLSVIDVIDIMKVR